MAAANATRPYTTLYYTIRSVISTIYSNEKAEVTGTAYYLLDHFIFYFILSYFILFYFFIFKTTGTGTKQA